MYLKRYSLSNLLLYGIIAICMLTILRLNIGGTYTMSVVEIATIFILLSIFLFFYFVIEKRNKALKHRPVLIMILVLFLIANIITTCLLPTNYSILMIARDDSYFEFTAEISNDLKIVSIFSTATYLFMIYVFLGILPQKIYSLKQLRFVFLSLIIVGLVAVIYSFCANYESYTQLFDGVQTERLGITSFTDSPNNYAAIIFFSILSCIYMHHITKRFYYYVLIIFFALSIVFTLSRTYSISTFILIAGYLLFRAIHEFRKHKIKVLISLIIVTLLIGGIAIPYIICVFNNCIESFPPFVVVKLFIDRLSGGLSGREYDWRQTIDVINYTSTWAFGMGFALFDSLFYLLQFSKYGEGAISSTHNSFLQIIVDGGFALAIFIIIIFIFTIYASFRIYKKHKKLFWLNLIVLISFLFQMFFESASPLVPGIIIYNYCLMSVFMFVPVLATYYHDRNGSLVNIEKPLDYTGEEKLKEFNFSNGFAFIFSLAFVMLFGIIKPLYLDNSLIFLLGIACGVSTVLFPFFAYAISCKYFSFRKWIINVILPFLIMATLFMGIAHLFVFILPPSELINFVLLFAIPGLYFAMFMALPILRKRSGFISKIIYGVSLIAYKSLFVTKTKKHKEKDIIVHDDEYYRDKIKELLN